MATSQYRRGADFERTVRKFCDDTGALLTIRSAGSKGKVDIHATFPDQVRLIQCKLSQGNISKEDRVTLVELATSLTEATSMKHVAYLAYKHGGGLIMQSLAA